LPAPEKLKTGEALASFSVHTTILYDVQAVRGKVRTFDPNIAPYVLDLIKVDEHGAAGL